MSVENKILRVISFDPGTKNFAFAITEHRLFKGVLQSRTIDNGLLEFSPLSMNQKDLEVIPDLSKELYELLDDDLDGVVIERFMTRGHGIYGGIGEVSNLVIGILFQLSLTLKRLSPTLLTSSQWKTAYNTVRKVNKTTLEKDYMVCRVTPHQWDAVLMGVYFGAYLTNRPAFEDLKRQRRVYRLMELTEYTSRNSLLNRRKERSLES